MNLHEMKSVYQNDKNDKSRDELKKMSRAKSHPVFRRIRIQLIFESAVWTLFLSVYYSGFDGDQKPIMWNVILIVSVLLLLLHNVLGYQLTQFPVTGSNLADSLRGYLKKIKRYARISISTRVVAIFAILFFFASSIDWNRTKFIASGLFVVLIISVQIYFLWKVWKSRIRKIETQVHSLELVSDLF